MDYYKLMGLPKSATQDQIKRSYRKFAIKWHPDQNKSESAVEKFKQLQEAYEVLSDPIKKSRYDLGVKTRPSHSRPKSSPPKGKGKSAAGPKPKKRKRKTHKESDFVYEADKYIYTERENFGRSIHMHVKMDHRLKEGGWFYFKVKKRMQCFHCMMEGEVAVACPNCQLNGCMLCDHTGTITQVCPECNGQAKDDNKYFIDTVPAEIPPDCFSGQMINVLGGGESSTKGRNGNLNIVLI